MPEFSSLARAAFAIFGSQSSILALVPPSAKLSTIDSQPSEQLPNGIPIPGNPGFVQSPYDPKFIIDVRGFPPGTLVNDPNNQ